MSSWQDGKGTILVGTAQFLCSQAEQRCWQQVQIDSPGVDHQTNASNPGNRDNDSMSTGNRAGRRPAYSTAHGRTRGWGVHGASARMCWLGTMMCLVMAVQRYTAALRALAVSTVYSGGSLRKSCNSSDTGYGEFWFIALPKKASFVCGDRGCVGWWCFLFILVWEWNMCRLIY